MSARRKTPEIRTNRTLIVFIFFIIGISLVLNFVQFFNTLQNKIIRVRFVSFFTPEENYTLYEMNLVRKKTYDNGSIWYLQQFSGIYNYNDNELNTSVEDSLVDFYSEPIFIPGFITSVFLHITMRSNLDPSVLINFLSEEIVLYQSTEIVINSIDTLTETIDITFNERLFLWDAFIGRLI